MASIVTMQRTHIVISQGVRAQRRQHPHAVVQLPVFEW